LGVVQKNDNSKVPTQCGRSMTVASHSRGSRVRDRADRRLPPPQYRVLPQGLLPVSGLFGGAPAGRTRGFLLGPAQLHVGIPKLTTGDLRDRESRRPCGIYAPGTGLVGHPQVAHYIGLFSEIRTCSRQSLWQAVRSRSSSCGVDQSPDLTKGHARWWARRHILRHQSRT
jgi:hypothetical protein